MAEPSDATARPGSPRLRPWEGWITTGVKLGAARARPAPPVVMPTRTATAPMAGARRQRRVCILDLLARGNVRYLPIEAPRGTCEIRDSCAPVANPRVLRPRRRAERRPGGGRPT